jgi:protein-disulfide isomerase
MQKLTPPVNQNDHVAGSAHAIITLVEYGDYQCPYCGRAHPIVKEIQKTFRDQLRFVYRHFPLSNVHEYAVPAAIAAEAAGRQHKFWQMHDIIFEQQDQLSEVALVEFAAILRLNMVAFERDILDKTLEEKVEADFESGVRSGVNGTPSFFINGIKYSGAFDYDSLSTVIGDTILAIT